MPESAGSAYPERGRRRWFFADCVFDEPNWVLVVNEQRIAIEAKPLELLRELLNRAGDLVTKRELLDSVWRDVTVVEASLTTAVRKLRVALNDDQRANPIIETVPRIGYRLSIPVQVQDESGTARVSWAGAGDLRQGTRGAPPAVRTSHARRSNEGRTISILASVAILGMLGAFLAGRSQLHSSTLAQPRRGFTQRDAANALRTLDVGAVETMLAAGWDPNKSFDNESNAAINFVLGKCEWDRGHDQEQMVLMVRTLVDGGAKLDHRNVWGDTPYSIAKAVRYCGPNHPVTRSIRTMCYAGFRPLGDRCLASYEINRR
jgi:DNA-binding winged helix-turn-helix (wHTH) protein